LLDKISEPGLELEVVHPSFRVTKVYSYWLQALHCPHLLLLILLVVEDVESCLFW
jgi:hypothetical protein